MSYASGMDIGLTIGQQLLKFFSKDGGNNKIFSFSELHQGLNTINEEIKAQSFRLAHAIKGRRRYYIDALKQNEKLAKVLSLKLKELPYIKEVTTNINTGSLLIIYSCAENIIDDIFAQLKNKVFAFKHKVTQMSNQATTMASDTILMVVKEINEWVKKKTNNVIDLRVLVSSFFALRGIRKILTMGQRPNGPQMLWWAFSILRGIGK